MKPPTLDPNTILVRRTANDRRVRKVHLRRQLQCTHDDCREHPELAEACYQSRRRIEFGTPVPEVRPIALCGIGSSLSVKSELVEPGRTFAAQWAFEFDRTVERYIASELFMPPWAVSPAICAHCLEAWKRIHSVSFVHAVEEGDVLSMIAEGLGRALS